MYPFDESISQMETYKKVKRKRHEENWATRQVESNSEFTDPNIFCESIILIEIVRKRVVLANEGRDKPKPYNSNNKKHNHSKRNSLELLHIKNCQKAFPTMCSTTNDNKLKPLGIKSCKKAS